jgi:hypothetical protein
MIHSLLNVVGGSTKRKNMITDINHEQVTKASGLSNLKLERVKSRVIMSSKTHKFITSISLFGKSMEF